MIDRALSDQIAAHHGLEPAVLWAVVLQESGGDQWALRLEPRYPYLWDVRKKRPFRRLSSTEARAKEPPSDFRSLAGTASQEWIAQQSSWGLCVAEGTRVATEYGWRPIESVLPGDRVVNDGGQFAAVSAVSAREADCLSFRVALNLPLRLTAEHPMLVRKASFGRYNTGRREVKHAVRPEWLRADEVGEWDLVAHPKQLPVVDVESLQVYDLLARPIAARDPCQYVSDGADLVLQYKGGTERARCRSEVAVGRDLLELVGLYLAEGHAMEKEKGASFAFHRKETHLQQLVPALFKKVFGGEPRYKIRYSERDNGAQVAVYGPAARWLTRLVPGNALTKQIPAWMLWLPIHKQAALVRGMWLGDGCLGSGHYTTASESLAYGMTHMLQRLGIVGRMVKVRTWFNVGLNSHDAVERFSSATGLPVVWPQTMIRGLRRNNATAWRADDDFIYYPIRGVDHSGASRVFDMQVPTSSSFVAGRSIVHNCQIMGAVARELGFSGPFLTSILEPSINLNLAAQYLKKLQEWSEYDLTKTLAAYNAGKGGAGSSVGLAYANQVIARRDALVLNA